MGGILEDFARGGLIAFARGRADRPSWVASAVHATAKSGHGIDWGAILMSVGVPLGVAASIAAIIAIIPMTRNGVLWAWRAMLMRAGLPYHRYARKFIDRYGTYENPYLRVKEKRDLRTTYVPLSFKSGDAQSVAVATEVLTNLPAERLVIVGDPGSGKSTLLRAYGVGVLESQFTLARRARVVPYLIPMRDLAAFLDEDKGIAGFIIDKILNEYGVFKLERATEFFVRTLQQEQAVVMLDGLDEVPDDRQHEMLSAVIAFMGDTRPECPTGRAKILLTCRTQNFEMLRENWMSALGAYEAMYALASLRDSEITSYLIKFKSLFKSADGPARFMRSVRESKTLELLRAPLILAIAVGLYADRPTMIPSTVSELYHRMIEELLDRHAFRHERRPDESLLRYRRNDKYQLLREFALSAAQESGNFADFTRADLDLFAADLGPRLDAVDDEKAMVAEIIRHSGLLSDAGPGGLWHYAHRSIQEFLAAEELRLRGQSDGILLDRANDLNWRQTIQLYTAGQEARQVDDFLRQLAKRNSELAAHCLQAARPSDDAARTVLDALEPITDAGLGALAAATRSPRVPVRAMAVERLTRAIIRSRDIISPTSANVDDMLPLLETIADTNAGEIAGLMPHTIGLLPDDPRLVKPLWQCLSAEGIERLNGCDEIVLRLLTLVMEPNAFAELERQDPHDRRFLGTGRLQAYPFRNALPPDHNLVTLLAWADYLSIAPDPPNRFFAAKAAGKLRSAEADRRHTIVIVPFTVARIFSIGILIAALITSVAVLAILLPDGHFPYPFGWWTILAYFGIGESPIFLYAMVFLILSEIWSDMEPSSEQDGNGNIIYAALKEGYFFGAAFILVPFLFVIAPAPLAESSFLSYTLCSMGSAIFFWITACKLFVRGHRRYYIYRPNKYVDMYEDPKSFHWLAKRPSSQRS